MRCHSSQILSITAYILRGAFNVRPRFHTLFDCTIIIQLQFHFVNRFYRFRLKIVCDVLSPSIIISKYEVEVVSEEGAVLLLLRQLLACMRPCRLVRLAFGGTHVKVRPVGLFDRPLQRLNLFRLFRRVVRQDLALRIHHIIFSFHRSYIPKFLSGSWLPETVTDVIRQRVSARSHRAIISQVVIQISLIHL